MFLNIVCTCHTISAVRRMDVRIGNAKFQQIQEKIQQMCVEKFNVKCACTSVSLSSSAAVACMCIQCGRLTLFFHQPSSLLTSYVPSLLPLLLLTPLSPPHRRPLGSPVREPSVRTGQRAHCASRPSTRAHRRTHKHLNHTDHLALGSRSLSGIHW